MNTRRMRPLVHAVALLLATGTASAQALHADERAYFASASAEQAARTVLAGQTAALQAATEGDPATRFRQAEQLQAQCLRHYAYLHLQAARDARDRRPAQALDQVMGVCSRIARAGRAALHAAPAAAAWANAYPFLRARAAGSRPAQQRRAG